MNQQKILIVNADDFGQNRGINRGIIEAYEQGVVTSASLMVRWPAAREAAAYARAHPELSLGLHVDLGEWVYQDDDWKPRYEVVDLGDSEGVEQEVSRQLTAFQELMDKNPSHLDSHQHVHLRESMRDLFLDLAERLGVPLRRCHPRIRYCGDFYGQTTEGLSCADAVSREGLCKILGGLESGVTELCCHPGYSGHMDTTYQHEREVELQTLCDPSVRATMESEGIVLSSFSDLTGHLTLDR